MNITRQYFPILWLTIRQFLDGKAIRVVIGGDTESMTRVTTG